VQVERYVTILDPGQRKATQPLTYGKEALSSVQATSCECGVNSVGSMTSIASARIYLPKIASYARLFQAPKY